MLRVAVISVGLLMASAGQASAPPSPRGGRKPSAPVSADAVPAPAPPPPAAPAAAAAETPAAEAPAPPNVASAHAPRKAAKITRTRIERDRAADVAATDRAAAAAAADPGAPVPPSLSTGALRQEMAAGRPAPAAAGSEREKLEALSADLLRARTALQAETARLEALLKSRPRSPGEAPGGEGGSMPVGDPMAPVSRPASAPGAANQVEVVSRAMKGMKPEQAAAIIGHLNRSLAADVLQRMRPADAGLILGFLKPELGAALATEIASREPPPKSKNADKEKP
jgi:flagellar motility protein MotE (MotC chaperone)